MAASTLHPKRGKWRFAETRYLDREEAEREGTFGRYVAELNPDVVIDLICYRLESCHLSFSEQRERSQPFFAWCSFIKPHHPFDPPAPYDTMYNPADVVPPIGNGLWRDKDLYET